MTEHDGELADVRARATAVFQRSDTAAQVVDEQNRLVWTSPQLRAITGLCDAEDLAEGQRIGAAAVEGSDWAGVITGPVVDDLARQLASPPSGTVWDHTLPVRLSGQDQELSVLGINLVSGDGRRAGTALVYSPQLPAQVVTMLSRGDAAMFGRMAELTEPAPRAAAVLFADIDASARLSRRLPTQIYFELIRALTTAVDQLVAERCGIVGKHAGDGMSAFFLADTCRGESGAAHSAISMAIALPTAVRKVVGELAGGGSAISIDDCRVNVGVHWGAKLYMGQIVTGGRLEVTALGDEVNETARIEQAASGGEVLASKTLLERLDDDDARAVDIDPRTRSYELLGDRAGGDEKIQRDAGTLAVTRLRLDGDATVTSRELGDLLNPDTT